VYLVEQVYPAGVCTPLLQAQPLPIDGDLDARVRARRVTRHPGDIPVPPWVRRERVFQQRPDLVFRVLVQMQTLADNQRHA
jgi:hypothetical protein